MTCTDTHEFSPFIRFEHEKRDRLVERTPLSFTQEDITHIASLDDPVGMSEVDVVYRPLTTLLQLYVGGRRCTTKGRRAFLDEIGETHTPFIIGIAGSIVVGKSMVARLLQLLLQRWVHTPRVGLITTDGFLYPNKISDKKGILMRKEFLESYNRVALIGFLAAVKSGASELEMPVYSHTVYNIVEGEELRIQQPDILIIEGLSVLQPPRIVPGYVNMAVSDYFNLSIYVDVSRENTEQWYVDRFLELHKTTFSKADSFFKTCANLSNEEAEVTARMIRAAIGLPNLRENISTTRERATMAFRKDSSHCVGSLLLHRD